MIPFNIVLVAPEIPQNTGSIGRLAVSTDSVLHLIDPLGFSLDEKHLRRAGMDYWKHLHLCRYPDWKKFLELNPGAVLHLFSTHGKKSYFDVRYTPGDYLVFGRESAGLPPELYTEYADRLRLIPMPGTFYRSLNLANSVSIALYEALRQTRTAWDSADIPANDLSGESARA